MKLKLLVSLLVLALACSCASSPYKVSLNAGESLRNKKAVVLEIGIAKHSLTYIPLIDAGIYNIILASNAEYLKAAQKKENRDIYQKVTGWFRNSHNMTIIRSPYPFADKKLPLNFFRKSSAPEIKQSLAAICEENNADCLVTVMSQYSTNWVWVLGIAGINRLLLEICVFDRNGSLIGYGTANSRALILQAQDTEGFASLYDLMSRPAKDLIIALGIPQV